MQFLKCRPSRNLFIGEFQLVPYRFSHSVCRPSNFGKTQSGMAVSPYPSVFLLLMSRSSDGCLPMGNTITFFEAGHRHFLSICTRERQWRRYVALETASLRRSVKCADPSRIGPPTHPLSPLLLRHRCVG